MSVSPVTPDVVQESIPDVDRVIEALNQRLKVPWTRKEQVDGRPFLLCDFEIYGMTESGWQAVEDRFIGVNWRVTRDRDVIRFRVPPKSTQFREP